MKNISTIIILFSLFFIVSGCALAPQYLRPELPVADTFTSSYINPKTQPVNSLQVQDVSKQGWRDVFTDPALQQLIETALANNRDLLETALNIETYREQYHIQRSAKLPSIGATGYGRKQRTLAGAGHATAETYSLDLGTTAYELDFFGRIRDLSEQALEQYLAMEETHKSATISLVAEVVRAYLTLLADRELLQISEDTREVEEESYSLIEQRLKAGVANELDLAQARTSLETVKANLALYKRRVALDVHYLQLLAGTSLPRPLVEDKRQLSTMSPLAIMPSTLSSKLLLQRPDILAAEHELQGANANIGAARAAFFPNVSLSLGAGVISSDLSDLFNGGSGSWLFSPSISIPIFNAGKLKAELNVAKIRKELYVVRYEKAIQTAFREVSDSLASLVTYEDQLRAQKANLEANQQYYSHARSRYQQGIDSFLTLLDAQRSLYSSRQNFITLKLAQLENQAMLYKVLGGGWKESTDTTPETDNGQEN